MKNNYKDTYQQVTDYVIEHLEKGVAIWRKPWHEKAGIPACAPKNLQTQKPYKGWNHFYLSWMGRIQDYASPFFLTFKQAEAMGGRIKKGSKGYPIVKWVAQEQAKKAVTVDGEEEGTQARIRLIPVTHIVFNALQTEGIHIPAAESITFSEPERISLCENIVSSMPEPPSLRHGGERAYYSRYYDHVQMPPMADFNNAEEYYSTLFHELVHSTGHEKRLNRKDLIEHDGFGGQNYSREELTAEMGAAFLCGVTAIEQKTIKNSAAYIGGWLKKLKEDKTLILSAASKAQAAADYILTFKEHETTRQISAATAGQ